jgi:soluble lytic murein transglycosylase-like protein
MRTIMLVRVAQSLLLLMLLSSAVMAQVRSGRQSVEERARQLEPYIIASAKRHGVDAGVLRVVCYMESRFRVNALSPKGARGPMQFMPETARRYGLKNPHDPQESLDAAARYLRNLLERFSGRIDLALAAYNAGEGTVESYRSGKPLLLRDGKIVNPRKLITGGIPPYRETEGYVAFAMRQLSLTGDEKHSSQFRTSINKKPITLANRDFSIDVMNIRSETPLPKGEKPRALFIEVP